MTKATADGTISNMVLTSTGKDAAVVPVTVPADMAHEIEVRTGRIRMKRYLVETGET